MALAATAQKGDRFEYHDHEVCLNGVKKVSTFVSINGSIDNRLEYHKHESNARRIRKVSAYILVNGSIQIYKGFEPAVIKMIAQYACLNDAYEASGKDVKNEGFEFKSKQFTVVDDDGFVGMFYVDLNQFGCIIF